jgi:hypothetical protein
MQKFLSIPVTNEQKQLVSCNDIKLIEQFSTTVVKVTYGGGKVTSITHATAASGNEEMRDAIQDGVVQVLKQQWTEVILEMDSLPLAVSGIAIA